MYLEYRIEAFLESVLLILRNLNPEQYRKHQQSLASKLKEKLKNMTQETSRHWSHISSRYLDFEQHVQDAEFLKHISLESLIQFYQEKIAINSSKRRKLSVHIKSNKMMVDYTNGQMNEIERVAKKNEMVTPETLSYHQSQCILSQPVVPKSITEFMLIK
jgi:secreted Zn-dependent insulinase-like peptidase